VAPFFETQCTQPQPTQAPPRCTKCNSPPFNCQCTSVDYGNIILVGAPKSVTNKLQRVLNAAAWIVTDTRNMIKDCHIYCILSCTGWTSRSGSCISLLWWSTDVSRTRRRSICWTTACQSLKLPVVSNCNLPLVISFYWSHDIVSEHSAIGLLLWLARCSGTHWQMNCKLTLVIGLN